jgi:hypothetical protein
MKIYIGPYRNWIGPYQIAEKLMFWVPKEKDEYGFSRTSKKVYDFGDRLSNIDWLTNVCQWVENKKKRKIKIRIDKYDTWSVDGTLAPIILPMLKQLKATKHGSTMVDLEDVPVELRGTSTEDYDNQLTFDFYKSDTDLSPNIHDRWNWVMDEMIWAFEQLNDDDNDAQFHSGESDIQFIKRDDGLSEMVKGPNDTSHFDIEGFNKHHDRIQRGTTLFGKYFKGLWD